MSGQTVPMLDLVEQYGPLRQELLGVVEAALDSGQFIMGGAVRDFEFAFAEYVGARHAVACASGSDALLLALMALGVGPGDAVITTPYSFFSTVSSITRLGALPLLVDIEAETYNLDVVAARELLLNECYRGTNGTVHGRSKARVRAVIPVHLFGQCTDMTALTALAEEYSLAIVEDAAQAIGSKWAGAQAGTLGDMACFSFYPAKNLGAMGDGGILTTDGDEHAEMLRKLRLHGAKPKYVHQYVGINSRLDAIQAGFLQVLLPHLEEWEAARCQHADAYTAALGEQSGVSPPIVRPEAHSVFNQYVIRCTDRDALRDFLTSRGVQTEIYYPVPLHLQECFAFLEYGPGAFPESERAAHETLALPVGPTLTEAQQATVVNAIKELAA